MSNQYLIMKYHPAKKEIEFKRYQNNKEIVIRNDSRLQYYMNKKGKFVLQDFGNEFFRDIEHAFDGISEVEIKVITTKLDYEDFEQMVEYFNEESQDFKITSTLLAELPDMKETFTQVKNYGYEVSSILEGKKQDIFTIPLTNDTVRKAAESFANEIDSEIKAIKEKVETLEDANVNLCFAGVYSTGKSALINSILGYKILPEAIKSETAKMIKICSPQNSQKISIDFKISNICTLIEWNETNNIFEFKTGPSENIVKSEIQKLLNDDHKENKKCHEQMYDLLKFINAKPEISSVINIYFNIPLDTENVKFTIYDTPGTDSNYSEHKDVLYEALENQTQSILIFVNNGNKLEGEGNNVLLNYIKDAENKSNKACIDIGRSLFVMNYADSIPKDTRIALQYGEVKNKEDEDFSIKLADKKLFFTSALYAYAAKATLNNIATIQDQQYITAANVTISSELFPMGYCYKQDRCATSELATKRMIEKSDLALEEAKKEGNDAKVLEITSGLYTLENEIKLYGEKFASAVKAYAIIDSVDKAFLKMTHQADSLINTNTQDINEVENNIAKLKETIETTIETKYQELSLDDSLPETTIKELQLDSETLEKELTNKASIEIDKILKKWFFNIAGKVHVKEQHKQQALEIIKSTFKDYSNKFFAHRKCSLEKQRNLFLDSVKQAILDNGQISENAKKFILDIEPPEINKPEVPDVTDIYNDNRKTEKILWFNTEYLDKENFIADVARDMRKKVAMMADDYKGDYVKSLNSNLAKIKSQFISNMETYSLSMKGMLEDKESMKQLGDKLASAALALRDCQENLNNIIWKEVSTNE
ncbi:MAG: dynamin family protein [Spirochaetia bacterium]|nr:dynamin family protein [Spirochaetia bacterium]